MNETNEINEAPLSEDDKKERGRQFLFSHVTLVVNVPRGCDVKISNLHPSQPTKLGHRADSRDGQFQLLEIPVGNEALMRVQIHNDAPFANLIFLVPPASAVGVTLEEAEEATPVIEIAKG